MSLAQLAQVDPPSGLESVTLTIVVLACLLATVIVAIRALRGPRR